MEIKSTRKGDTWHIGVRICSVNDPSRLSCPFLAHLVQSGDKDKHLVSYLILLVSPSPDEYCQVTWFHVQIAYICWHIDFASKCLGSHRHTVFLSLFPDILLLTVHRKWTRSLSWMVLITQPDGILSGKKAKWVALNPYKRYNNHRWLNKRILFLQWSTGLTHICQGNIKGRIHFAVAMSNMRWPHWCGSLKQQTQKLQSLSFKIISAPKQHCYFRANIILKAKD